MLQRVKLFEGLTLVSAKLSSTYDGLTVDRDDQGDRAICGPLLDLADVMGQGCGIHHTVEYLSLGCSHLCSGSSHNPGTIRTMVIWGS
jgi:hypothetical protein